MHHKQFHGSPDFLRSPERVARLQVERVVELTLSNLEPSTLLDVGTGSGLFAEAFADHVPNVLGIDLAPRMLRRARTLLPYVRYVQAEMEWLPFHERAFDLTFLGLALHETDDLAHTLSELRRCTRYRIAALEWPYQDEPFGPPLHHRLRPVTVVLTARQVGLSGVRVLSLQNMVLYLFASGQLSPS